GEVSAEVVKSAAVALGAVHFPEQEIPGMIGANLYRDLQAILTLLGFPPPAGGRAELRNEQDQELDRGLERLISFLPEGHGLTVDKLRSSVIPFADGPIFQRGSTALVILDPKVFVEVLPKELRPREGPWRLVFIYSLDFDSLLAIHGNKETPQVIVADGSVDYYESTGDEAYQKRYGRSHLAEVPLLARTMDDIRQGTSFLSGAYMVIRAKAGADKKIVLQQWADALTSTGILGKKYIAAPGANVETADMDAIASQAYWTRIQELGRKGEISFLAEFWDLSLEVLRQYLLGTLIGGRLGWDKLDLLPPAVGVSEENGGLPKFSRSIGDAAAAALVALKRNPYMGKRYLFSNEDKTKPTEPRMSVLFYGYGPKSAAVTANLLDAHPTDVGIDIVGIVADEGGIISHKGGLPPRLIRQINAHIAQGKSWREILRSISGQLSSGDEGTEVLSTEEVQKGDFLLRRPANVLALDSDPLTFTREIAEKFQGEVVDEVAPNVTAPEALRYLGEKRVLFLPYPSVNVARAYFAWREVANAALDISNERFGRYHFSDQITEQTISNLWDIFEMMAEREKEQTKVPYFSDLVRSLNDESANQQDLLTSEIYRLSYFLETERGNAVWKKVKKRVRNEMNKKRGARILVVVNRMEQLMKQGAPYVIALNMASFDQVYAESFFSKVSQLKNQLRTSTDQMERRAAAHRLDVIASLSLSLEQRRKLAQIFGDSLLHDSYYRVQALAARGLGMVGRQGDEAQEVLQEAVQPLKEYLFNPFDPQSVQPSVREWAVWALKRLGVKFTEEDIAQAKLELKGAAQKAGEAEQREKTVRKAGGAQSKIPPVYQIEFMDLAKIEFKLAVMYRFRDQLKEALGWFNKAIEHFKKSQEQGGGLPIQTQWSIADIFLELSRSPGEQNALVKAREALLRLLISSQAEKELGLYKSAVPGTPRKTSLSKMFMIDSLPPEVSDSWAGAIEDYLHEREQASIKPSPVFDSLTSEIYRLFGPFREDSNAWDKVRERVEKEVIGEGKDRILAVIDRLQELMEREIPYEIALNMASSEQAELEQLSPEEDEILRNYNQRIKGIITASVDDDRYIQLLLLAASNIYQKFPDLTERIIEVLSNRPLEISPKQVSLTD
ncbi:MAG: hypothetical protein HYS56_00455, partial [Candidatus Omnitrophica bacterium]|nr:hypothetical protein [Candidatus Omnitrophota bacterium]